SLASGNPVGAPERWPQSIEAWRRSAHDAGLSLAVMGAREAGGIAYAEAGLAVGDIGDGGDERVNGLIPAARGAPLQHHVAGRAGRLIPAARGALVRGPVLKGRAGLIPAARGAPRWHVGLVGEGRLIPAARGARRWPPRGGARTRPIPAARGAPRIHPGPRPPARLIPAARGARPHQRGRRGGLGSSPLRGEHDREEGDRSLSD